MTACAKRELADLLLGVIGDDAAPVISVMLNAVHRHLKPSVLKTDDTVNITLHSELDSRYSGYVTLFAGCMYLRASVTYYDSEDIFMHRTLSYEGFSQDTDSVRDVVNRYVEAYGII